MRQVTAAVIIEGGRLLVARRPPGDPLAGLWELPGGKVEPGESPEDCLRRELVEELELTADVQELLATTIYHYEHGSFEILAYRTHRASDMTLRAHDGVAWITPEELGLHPLAPADVTLAQQLRSEGIWA